MTDEQMIAIRQHAAMAATSFYDGSGKPISVIIDAAKTIEEYVMAGIPAHPTQPALAKAQARLKAHTAKAK